MWSQVGGHLLKEMKEGIGNRWTRDINIEEADMEKVIEIEKDE